MRIVVIGGTRFIGLAAVKRLLALGHQVAVFNRGQTPVDLPEGVQHIQGDRADIAQFRDQFAAFAPDVAYHNVIVTEADAHNFVEAFTGIAKRIVMVSSLDVYRPYSYLYKRETHVPIDYPMTEDAPLREAWYPYRGLIAQDESHPLWMYDKIPAERVVLSAPGLPGTVLRLPMVYGENDAQRRLTPHLKPMIDGRPAIVMGESESRWRSTYGYVENVAACIAAACTDDRAAGQVYNVGEITPTLLQVATLVKEALGWSGEFVIVPDDELPEALRSEYDLTAHLAASDARIRNELGVELPVTTEEGIRRTVTWEREHLNPEVNYAETLNYAAQDEVLQARGV